MEMSLWILFAFSVVFLGLVGICLFESSKDGDLQWKKMHDKVQENKIDMIEDKIRQKKWLLFTSRDFRKSQKAQLEIDLLSDQIRKIQELNNGL
jgi:hypothetical protein